MPDSDYYLPAHMQIFLDLLMSKQVDNLFPRIVQKNVPSMRNVEVRETNSPVWKEKKTQFSDDFAVLEMMVL